MLIRGDKVKDMIIESGPILHFSCSDFRQVLDDRLPILIINEGAVHIRSLREKTKLGIDRLRGEQAGRLRFMAIMIRLYFLRKGNHFILVYYHCNYYQPFIKIHLSQKIERLNQG
jgi:hypothetical protein